MRNFFTPESHSYRLPQPPALAASPNAFLLCPVAAAGMNPAVWMLYQMAFQQAQAVVRPSLPERDLLAVWN